MSRIRLYGDTSGYVELKAPDNANNSTIEFPDSPILTQSSASATYSPISSPTFTGTVSLPSTTSIGNISSTELSHLDGVTSSIQDQIDLKVSSNSPSLLPAGGSASAVLTKTTSSDYDVSWQTPIMPIYAHGRTLANGTAVYLSGMSVSRSSAGVYVYTFDVTRSDTNFSVLATPAAAPGTDPNMFVHTFTNSGFTITVGVGDNSGNTDVSTDFAHSVVVLA